jgi:hypothetical protein
MVAVSSDIRISGAMVMFETAIPSPAVFVVASPVVAAATEYMQAVTMHKTNTSRKEFFRPFMRRFTGVVLLGTPFSCVVVRRVYRLNDMSNIFNIM